MMATTTNSTTMTFDSLPPLPDYTLRPLPPLITGLPDAYLGMILLVVAYWSFSMFFHLIDTYDLFPQYRLHTPAEVQKRNHVGRWECFRDVVIQQIVQFGFGVLLSLVEDVPMTGREEYDVAVWARRVRMAQRVVPGLLGSVGVDARGLAGKLTSEHASLAGALAGGIYPDLTQTLLLNGQPTTTPAFARWELYAARAIYHLAIPFVQFLAGICIVDTWQYFLHRFMHTNKYLYTTFHSRHHRLYVPYAFGALYNHPFEGFLLDTLGTGLAYLVTGMTVRQSMCFFTGATIKTVDDHCGYSFPWDPLQRLTSNNAGYHDVHHQSWGIKTNFSQPFFTFWDTWLGTKWTGGDVSARYERAKIAAQKKVDADTAAEAITKSTPSDSFSAVSDAPYTHEAEAASSTARTAQSITEPAIPPRKASAQALASRQQVLDAGERQGGGTTVLAEETTEEIKAQKAAKRAPMRKRTTSSGLKGFADRVGESLQGKATGVLGVESRRR